MNPTDTPRTDACPHCGSKEERPKSMRYLCGSWWPIKGEFERPRLCYALERATLHAENQKLRELLDELINGSTRRTKEIINEYNLLNK